MSRSSSSPTLTGQWQRGATDIPGANAVSYNFVAADVGAMIGCNVTATKAAGSAGALGNAVGPIIAAQLGGPPQFQVSRD
jgi:hypothetical protein